MTDTDDYCAACAHSCKCGGWCPNYETPEEVEQRIDNLDKERWRQYDQ